MVDRRPAHPTTHASNHGGNRRIFVIILIFIYTTVNQHDRTSGRNSRFCLHHPHGRGLHTPHYRRHPADYERKEAETRSQNNLPDTTPLVFLEVGIRDASEFYSPITITGHVG
ncbi:hypothetical protein ACQX0P_09025 [Corynebacterium diphtheriae]|nr:hypothetical protein D9B42_02875 [Corynebacterium diphtheriae]